MTLLRALAGFVRAVLIAAATAAAAFGLLAIFQPFAASDPRPAAIVDTSQADAMQARIEAMRLALRDAETALGDARRQALVVTPAPGDELRGQYDTQILAATERRDLALRHAEAIRDALQANGPLTALAAIRDSAIVGQMLSQQASLDGQIATEGARLRANHPTMRALTAQRDAVVTQIRTEAANIAAALEAEARIDDAQIALLRTRQAAEMPSPSAEVPAPAPDVAALEAAVAAQRAELDGLVDAYFNIPPAPLRTAEADPLAGAMSAPNLAVVGTAGAAALLFQLLFRRRRTPSRPADDMAEWRADADTDLAEDPADVAEAARPMRAAS